MRAAFRIPASKADLSSLFSPENFHPVRARLEENHRDKSLERTRERMGPLYEPNQVLGRRATIGCVALEVTQRCNLDCSLCYLSERSEEVKDLPLEEIFRRIDEIKNHFAAGTDIQITGGDPTMRDKKDLIAIIQRIRELGMRPTLMTNGMLMTRPLLKELVDAGLNDVAFHMDTTFGLKGYKNEMELNVLREKYIEYARGLPVAVIFNTTVHKGNFHEIPDLIKFFRRNADVVGMASFQLQADTGRGVLRSRDTVISLESVRAQIQKGAETAISWDTILVGHPKCHRLGITLEANGNLYDLNYDPKFFSDFLEEFKHVMLDRRDPRKVVRTLLAELAAKPHWVFKAAKWFLPLLWRMRKDIIASNGKVNKLSFFCQNFMDAQNLDDERVHACSFMVMTGEGPVSMCAHNARRDDYILKPVTLTSEKGQMVWDPLTGKMQPVAQTVSEPAAQAPRNAKRKASAN